MQNTWLSLLPPLIVISIVFLTRRLNLALIIGILSAGLIAASGSILNAYSIISHRLCQQISDVDNLFLYGFLIIIGILAALINTTGGVNAFAHTIAKKIKSARSAQTASFFLSLLLFIDDYLSILTVGYVMRPLMDKFAIPRAKLAFLIHSLAGSVVILTPVSSWVTAITAYLEQAGIGIEQSDTIKILGDPLFVYLRTIPYIFYSFIIIASVWFIIHQNISFGPMKKIEKTQKKIKTEEEYKKTNSGISDVLLPLGTLLTVVFFGIPYVGGYYLFGGTRTLLEAFKHNQYTFQIMFVAGIAALIVGASWAIIRNVLTINKLGIVLKEGFFLMYAPVVMVFLASILGLLLRYDLLTGKYLASLLLGTVSISLLPLLFFIVSLITALITGSAWGTFALLLYIAVPMLTSLFSFTAPIDPSALPILFPVLGAIFSGAVCGDHISPISETTIMAATSADVDPLDHTMSQLPYAIPAILSSLLAFTIIGYMINYPVWISIGVALGISMIVCFVLLWLLQTFDKKP